MKQATKDTWAEHLYDAASALLSKMLKENGGLKMEYLGLFDEVANLSAVCALIEKDEANNG